MASLIWLDLDGNKHESDEYNDIESFRLYIYENKDNIKIVELLDCAPLESLYSESTYRGLFEYCINLVEVKDVVGTSSVNNMNGMFMYCEKLESVPYFDTSNVEYMCGMFNGCSNLGGVPHFNTLNVNNMAWMFNECSSLESVPLLDTSNVEDMDSMFDDCGNLRSYILPCNEFDTRSLAIKSYKGERLLKELNKLWQK